MIRLLIFDFDGLILETEGPIFQSWRELYQAYGQDLDVQAFGDIIGRSEMTLDLLGDLERLVGHPLDRQALQRSRRQREQTLMNAQQILPGVRAYLEDARRLGLMLAVASSSSRKWVTGHLERLGILPFFDVIKTREDVLHSKPAPDLFRAVLGAFDLHPDQAVVFEDSPNGILAAHRAGLFCVAVPTEITSQLSLDLADMRLNSLASVPLEKLLDQIQTRLAGGRP